MSTDVDARPGFDLDRAWGLDDRVAVRPEPFGALLYHFGTRRLSFLKNATVLRGAARAAEHPTGALGLHDRGRRRGRAARLRAGPGHPGRLSR